MDALEAFGLKPTIVQGATAGAAVFLILSEGPWLRRIAHAAGGALFAYYGTGALIEVTARWIAASPASERFGGLVFGLVGIYLAEGLVRAAKRVRNRSEGLTDGAIMKATGL